MGALPVVLVVVGGTVPLERLSAPTWSRSSRGSRPARGPHGLDRLPDPLARNDSRTPRRSRRYVAADVERHADPAHTSDLAVFYGPLTVFGVPVDAVNNGRRSAHSQAEDVGAWPHEMFGVR
ncbi:hypothetical protein OG417_34085 [Actinoallomurus sp. NBC_01490]|uniref:hypothetical protein n=1 Tax=Actinoallomurus sp. NBC_01490 TaxID=2903557 RepID=UPI002E31CBC9|nr:hypothetical protein [Actinoallomurus sp. NBC_01490]